VPGRRAPIHHRVAKKSEVASGEPLNVLSRKLFANVNSLFANGSDGDNASKSPATGVLLIGSSYGEAIRINPQDAVAHYNLGNLLTAAHFNSGPCAGRAGSCARDGKRSHKVWVVSGLLEGSERF
jgi:hypothetical protein